MPRSNGFEWAYRDLLISMLVVFMALSALALVSVVVKQKQEGVSQGSLVVTLYWDRAKNADVDLWVRAPDDKPVGYLHPGDRACNLVRDDLGRQRDSESRNEELIMCRGDRAGEWVVNAMLYAEYDSKYPTTATVEVRKVDRAGGSQILKRTVTLEAERDEITVARFRMDSNGELVPGSINQAPVALFGQ